MKTLAKNLLSVNVDTASDVMHPVRRTLALCLKRAISALALTIALFSGSQVLAAEHPAQALVVDTVDKFLNVVRNNDDQIKNDPAFLNAKIEELVVPHLDFESMTKLSIGKHWRKADDSQRVLLIKEFKIFLLNTYSSAIQEYKNGDVSFEKFKAGKREDRAVVRSQFSQAGSVDVPVVYILRGDKGAWKIFDIEVSQLSLVTNYRSTFSSEIARNGIDGLIDLLKSRNAEAG